MNIATVHEYKGKEADSVYIWNDSYKVFPHALTDSDDTESEAYEEERRIHYIACTRARKVSTILYLNNKMGDFVREMDLGDAEKLDTEGLHGVLKREPVNDDDKNLKTFSTERTDES